jgi:hypothetical protein
MPRRFESAVDAQIRIAQERGDFDNLPGHGKPIPGAGEPDDELWWVKGLIEREGLSTEAMLPAALRLRKEVETLPERLRELRSERAVRDLVDEMNREIRRELLLPTGPKPPPPLLDADEVVASWSRAVGRSAPPAATPAPRVPAPVSPAGRRRWWRRRS